VSGWATVAVGYVVAAVVWAALLWIVVRSRETRKRAPR
jgi:hypothetical protein